MLLTLLFFILHSLPLEFPLKPIPFCIPTSAHLNLHILGVFLFLFPFSLTSGRHTSDEHPNLSWHLFTNSRTSTHWQKLQASSVLIESFNFKSLYESEIVTSPPFVHVTSSSQILQFYWTGRKEANIKAKHFKTVSFWSACVVFVAIPGNSVSPNKWPWKPL